MKKILAVVLSLAMILSMTVVGFAAEAPAADAGVDAWAAYYAEVLVDENLTDEEKADAIYSNTAEPQLLLDALLATYSTLIEQGIDPIDVIIIVVDKLEEDTGINAEDELGLDINDDGFIGDPANGNAVKPTESTDVEGWTTYYVTLFAQAATDPSAMLDVVGEIAGDIMSGAIDMDTFTSVLPAAAAQVGENVVNQVIWGIEEFIEQDINSDGYVGKPDGSIDDGQLPEEEPSGGIGDFLSGLLDTVLGILGTIGDLLFGGGSDEPGTTPGTPDEDPWGDDFWGDTEGDGSTIPDTGDTTVFAVATVALVAGAALVMTRKKSDDAE